MTIIDNFGIKDIIDIVLVALLMYQAYRLLRRSGSTALFNGVLALLVIWIIVSKVFQMSLLGSILDKFFSVGIIAFIILFQDEIRRFISNLGMHRSFAWIYTKFSKRKDDVTDATVMQIVQACANMAKTYTGAIIVIEDRDLLDRYIELGQIINGEVSTRLIETVFFKNTPLHDGAMLISRDKIIAAGAILPVSHASDIPSNLGLRHRAALGISRETDAYVIVISEERGAISYVKNNEMEINITPQRLQELLCDKKYKNNEL